MHKNGRIIIDTRTYVVDEVFERYRRGMLIFYKKNLIVKDRKNKITWEVLEALSRGIPFPPVFVSELQTGELLVLDKSDRLRFLMEYLEYGLKNDKEYRKIQEMGYLSERDFLKDIFYSDIILHVIDYMNPRYMHMQVGAFIEEWSATQEQGVRNVLYQGVGMQAFDELLSEVNHPSKSRLIIQYNLIYFIMVGFAAFREFDGSKYQNADKFQLLEETIYKLKYKNYSFLRDLYEQFEYLYQLLNQKENRGSWFLHISSEEKMKYLCFMGAWMRIRNEDLEEIFESRRIRKMITDCDMGYRSINGILEAFREGNV